MIKLHGFKLAAGEPFALPQFFADNAATEWYSSLEIKKSFRDRLEYRNTVRRMVTSIERVEYYLMDGDKIIGMVCVSPFEDIHYRKLAGATLLWVLPEYRENIEVKRAVVKALRASAYEYYCKYYVRTSKVTPFITKQIVRSI